MTLRGRLSILAASPNQNKLYDFFNGLVDEIEALKRDKAALDLLVQGMKEREIEKFVEPVKPELSVR